MYLCIFILIYILPVLVSFDMPILILFSSIESTYEVLLSLADAGLFSSDGASPAIILRNGTSVVCTTFFANLTGHVIRSSFLAMKRAYVHDWSKLLIDFPQGHDEC